MIFKCHFWGNYPFKCWHSLSPPVGAALERKMVNNGQYVGFLFFLYEPKIESWCFMEEYSREMERFFLIYFLFCLANGKLDFGLTLGLCN